MEKAMDQSPIESMLPPIVSSRSLNWKPLLVEEYQQPPGTMDYSEEADHTIVLCLVPRPYRIHQVAGDCRYTGLYTKGDISIIPAEIPSGCQVEGDDHYLQIQIPHRFVQQVAQEAIDLDSSRLELTTAFAVRDPGLEQPLLMLRSELHKGENLGGQLLAESLANVLVVHLLRQYATTQVRVPIYEGGLGDRKILQVSEFIAAHLDQEIKLADLATLAGMSQFHFSRLFKQSMGVSPHQYLVQQRIERAKQLLKGSKLAIADIALQCGFNSQSHLGKSFREFTGMTPRDYRKG